MRIAEAMTGRAVNSYLVACAAIAAACCLLCSCQQPDEMQTLLEKHDSEKLLESMIDATVDGVSFRFKLATSVAMYFKKTSQWPANRDTFETFVRSMQDAELDEGIKKLTSLSFHPGPQDRLKVIYGRQAKHGDYNYEGKGYSFVLSPPSEKSLVNFAPQSQKDGPLTEAQWKKLFPE